MERDEQGRFRHGTMFKDYTGQKHDYLEALKLDHVEGKDYYWLCKCHKCGREKILSAKTFRTNKTCGCRVPYNSKERLYILWKGIKQRCNNPNHISYKNYGGKGIKVCSQWENDYGEFKKWALENGYDETLPRGEQTIDRIDGNKDYCPENCRWITIQEQQKNKDRTNFFECYGEIHTLSEWADITGIRKSVLHSRIYSYKWDIKDALERPIGKTHGKNYLYVIHNGEEKSITQISKETGIAHNVLKERYEKGIPIEETIREYIDNDGLIAKKYEYNGKKLSIPEWSKELGVSEGTLRSRLKKGRPYERVFTSEKLYSKRKK